MDVLDTEIDRLKRRVAGLEKALQIVTGHSGRMEENLKHLFDAISGTIPVPMVISTRSGEILFFNKKAREIFGYDETDFHGLTADCLYDQPDDRRTILRRITDEGEIRGAAVTMRKADGSAFPASLFSRSIAYEGKDSLLTVIHDLSEIRQEEKKRLAIERLMRQNQRVEAVGAMAAGIAHDFNNVLSVIFGRLQLAQIHLPNESPASKEIDEALKAADRAREMTLQILSFCRIKEEERKPLVIGAVVTEASRMVQSLIASGIDLQLRITCGPAIVLGDPTQIHQVLMNLVSNANYALKGRGGIIEIRIEETALATDDPLVIAGLDAGSYIRLSVRDNGPGMDPAVIERAFDPFFTTKPVGEGTGMGLAVVHTILKGHGGTVRVESEPGKGSVFHCFFPRINDMQRPADPAVSQKTIQGGNERILFVDDEKEILDIYGQMLMKLGYRVTTRTGADAALNLFERNPGLFDLIITDITMPVTDGMALASAIRRTRPDIPVILITGGSDDLGPAIQADKILRKPFTAAEIGAAVRELLDMKQKTGP